MRPFPFFSIHVPSAVGLRADAEGEDAVREAPGAARSVGDDAGGAVAAEAAAGADTQAVPAACRERAATSACIFVSWASSVSTTRRSSPSSEGAAAAAWAKRGAAEAERSNAQKVTAGDPVAKALLWTIDFQHRTARVTIDVTGIS